MATKKRKVTKNKYVKKLKVAGRNIKNSLLKTWKKDILEHTQEDLPIFIAGNKSDLERKVDFEKVASFDRNKQRVEGEIGFASIRGGSIFGEHEVMFIGESECISIKHIAYNRKVFAIGAVERALKIIQ